MSFEELIADMLAKELTYRGDANNGFTNELVPIISSSLLKYSDKSLEEPIDEETRKKAALHSAYHASLQSMAGHLRELGLCEHARFDTMLSVFAPSIPNQELVKKAFPYPWNEVRHARHNMLEDDLKKCEEDYQFFVDDSLEARAKMVDLAEIAACQMRRRRLSFTGNPDEGTEELGKSVRDTFDVLGIISDMEAYLSDNVPLADIIA